MFVSSKMAPDTNFPPEKVVGTSCMYFNSKVSMGKQWRFPFDWNFRNGAVHPGVMFSGKKLIPFEVFLFSRLYRCTVPFGAKFSLVFPVKLKAS